MQTKTAKPVGILLGDTHFSHEAPKARAEKGVSWYRVMERYIGQVKKLQAELEYKHHDSRAGNVHVYHSGDLLDTWDQPPELVNFLIRELPHLYGVPGQHDLPDHRLADLKRSAWWTLVEAGKVTYLKPNDIKVVGEVVVEGFPWGSPLHRCVYVEGPRLAVAHHYCCAVGCDPAFQIDTRGYSRVAEQLKEFDVIHTGDNHCHFSTQCGRGVRVFNAGTFMRRKADEKGYEPAVGVLDSDGTVSVIRLDTTEDRFVEVEGKVESVGLDPRQLIEDLANLQDVSLNYEETVFRFADKYKLGPDARGVISRLLRRAKKDV